MTTILAIGQKGSFQSKAASTCPGKVYEFFNLGLFAIRKVISKFLTIIKI